MPRKRSSRTEKDPTTFFQISLRQSLRTLLDKVVADGIADDASEWVRGLMRRELRALGYLETPRAKSRVDIDERVDHRLRALGILPTSTGVRGAADGDEPRKR